MNHQPSPTVCLVVGAGPAGLAAAIAAAGAGARTLVLEKNDRPGRKLLLAGGGRANLWDPHWPALDALDGFGRPGLFLRQCLAAFDWSGFLSDLGVEIERGSGAAYARGGAKALLAALLARADALGVEVRAGVTVRAARPAPGGGFEVEAAADAFRSSRLVIAAGGLTYPGTGSTGDGYALAAEFGHGVDSPRPALGELLTRPCFPDLAGTTVPLAELSVKSGRRRRAVGRGALLFTHRGLSGPAALDASLELARAEAGAGLELRADLAPGFGEPELAARLVARARAETKRTLATAGLGELLSVRLLERLAGLSGLDPRRRLGSFSEREFDRLAGTAKAVDLILAEAPEAGTAMVTHGGVSVRDIEPRTMESRLVPGLFFAGEVLAPAGPCGGFNLLMAFATGTAAGASAGRNRS